MRFIRVLVAVAGAASLWLAGGAPGARAQAAPGLLTAHADRPGARINPMMYGLMTEEINHAYDGGLYAELLQNRIFKDDANSPVHWSLVQSGGGSGSIGLDTSHPINSALTTCLRLSLTSASGRVGVANDGWWGIPIAPNTQYRASFYAQASAGVSAPLRVTIESPDGATVYAQAQTPIVDSYWKMYTVTLHTGDVTPSSNNRFVISTAAMGSVWLNLVSLFPPTYKDRPNGNRIDLMEKMAAMTPSFLRFPGGNYLDPGHYQWKITLGPLSERPGHPGAWGYRSSDGLGLLEFLEWCEDLGMEPLLGVSDGRDWLSASADVGTLVQDALDEIEYVTGAVDSVWGSRRAADGHPAPFALHCVEIGNEDFFDSLSTYNARFARFYDAIRARYPELQIIATRSDLTSRRPDLIDDHIYASVSDMLRAAHNYDNYSRTAPHVFVGEWATTVGSPTATHLAALSDAAYLTGLERNADVVRMACYAPLLVNVNPGASQWGTNLIGYDALSSFGSPSYYMQSMFSRNRGDVVLPVAVSPQAYTPPPPRGAIGVGTWSTVAEYRNVAVTNGSTTLYQKDFASGTDGWMPDNGSWQVVSGALRQTSTATNCRNTAGDPGWTDYTYTLQARKISGDEGFLIMFHVQDRDNFVWWNIGGWGNTRTSIERARSGGKTEIGQSAAVTVQTNVWYDIRIEVQGAGIKCYLNGNLVNQATDAATVAEPVFASASRDLTHGDVILKVVNVTDSPQQLAIDVPGVDALESTATAEVLTGQPNDVNSVAAPMKVAPATVAVTGVALSFVHGFPAYSVTVLRLRVKAPPFALSDAILAVRLAAGLQPATAADVQRLNVVETELGATRVDVNDAIRVARSAAGLDP
ncbi:MAG TPA: alpha-L-arabinofuranosidase C-terminal domain-containing protein [Armatimonadota bacterium]|jgi:alpha-L-arabinofuranosidase